jgi:hypothetical protein
MHTNILILCAVADRLLPGDPPRVHHSLEMVNIIVYEQSGITPQVLRERFPEEFNKCGNRDSRCVPPVAQSGTHNLHSEVLAQVPLNGDLTQTCRN